MMRSTWLPRRCYFGAARDVVEIRVFISSSEAPQTTQEILDLLFAPNLQEASLPLCRELSQNKEDKSVVSRARRHRC